MLVSLNELLGPPLDMDVASVTVEFPVTQKLPTMGSKQEICFLDLFSGSKKHLTLPIKLQVRSLLL